MNAATSHQEGVEDGSSVLPLFAKRLEIELDQIVFIALGNAKSSLFLVILRKIVLMIPLIFLLPMVFGGNTDAIFVAQPISDIITVIVAAFIFRHTFRKTLNKIEQKTDDQQT